MVVHVARGGGLEGGLVVAAAAAAQVEEGTDGNQGGADDAEDAGDDDGRGGWAGFVVFGRVEVDDADGRVGEEGVVEGEVAAGGWALLAAGFQSDEIYSCQ